MAQAALPRMWRDTRPVDQSPAVRVGPQAAASGRTASQTNWSALYLHLAFWTVVAIGYVAVCGVVSELDAVRYRLLQEIAVERGQQARLVREINTRASYANLGSVMQNHNLTHAPVDVLRIVAPHALPAEVSTVLLTPQPYCGYVSRPAGPGPQTADTAGAGMGDRP